MKRLAAGGAFLMTGVLAAAGQDAPVRPAVPQAAIAAIVEAFRDHRLVGLGDAHGDRLGEAFQLALIRDPGFLAAVNDIVVEVGNSRFQDVADRYVRGEAVAPETLRRIWLDTTQPHAAQLGMPKVLAEVRAINVTRPADRRLRVLLGEPPIDWDSLKTPRDYEAWEALPASSRDVFGAGLIRREVLAKHRRALALYGAGHFFRKVADRSLVTLLAGSDAAPFTIWTNVALELSTIQADVRGWSTPSLTLVRGTPLGRANLAAYLGPNAGDVMPEWLAPMEAQFDAVLYLGPLSAITLDRPPAWPCSEPALAERVRRANLMRPGMGDQIKASCAP